MSDITQNTSKQLIYKKIMLIRILILSLYCLLICYTATVWSAQQSADTDYYTLGVFPYLPPARIESMYAPVAADLSKVTDKPIKLKSRPDFDAFLQEVSKGRYDIIFVQPFDYVRLPAGHQYIPIVRWQGRLQAVFVAATSQVSESPDAMQYMRGKDIAMPDKNAAVSLLGKITLMQAGLSVNKDITIHYNKNHFECLKQVVLKKSVACVTAIPPLTLFEARTNNKLNIIAKSQTIPTPLFAVHKRVPVEVLKRIQANMQNWNSNEEGKHILHTLGFQGFVPADDKMYDPVRVMWKELSETER